VNWASTNINQALGQPVQNAGSFTEDMDERLFAAAAAGSVSDILLTYLRKNVQIEYKHSEITSVKQWELE
jgi:hypothetical protein